MGRTHCCFDNARMKSFFATLKKELIYRLIAPPCCKSRFGKYSSVGLKSAPAQHRQRGQSTSTVQVHSGSKPNHRWHSRACWVCSFLDYFMDISLKSVLHRQSYPKIRLNDSTIISTSFSELFLPNDNRIVPFARSGSSPIACNT